MLVRIAGHREQSDEVHCIARAVVANLLTRTVSTILTGQDVELYSLDASKDRKLSIHMHSNIAIGDLRRDGGVLARSINAAVNLYLLS